VFNIIGQSVRLLVDEAMLDVGVWTTSWDGRNDRGQSLASGVYMYLLREPGATRVQRLLLLK
jgi:hypothetical protein